MNIQDTSATQPLKNKKLLIVPYLTALIVGMMALIHLVAFEKFIQFVQDYRVTDGQGAIVLAVVIVGLEVFSLPFLIRLSMSRLARAFSALFVLLTPLVWLFLAMYVWLRHIALSDISYFGVLSPRSHTGFLLFENCILLGLATWSLIILRADKAFRGSK